MILDKPGKLTEREFAILSRHPAYTAEILSRLSCFREITLPAASHHERLDGRGYHRGLGAVDLSQVSRILCVADICDALRSARPYQPALALERVLDIMGREVGTALDPDCFDTLRTVLDHAEPTDEVATPAAVLPELAENYHQAA